MKIKVMSIVKHTVGTTTSIGSGMLVANIVKAFMPPEAKLLSKIAINTAGAVIAGMLGDASAKYAENVIDEAQQNFKAGIASVHKDLNKKEAE